jgi:hypothetical protein
MHNKATCRQITVDSPMYEHVFSFICPLLLKLVQHKHAVRFEGLGRTPLLTENGNTGFQSQPSRFF